jgi:hypothetical protein
LACCLVAGCAIVSGLNDFDLVDETNVTTTASSGSGQGGGIISGGGSGAAGTGGSGGTALGEDCFNGADDDGDGNPDCADPDCAAQYSCVPESLAPIFVQEATNCQDPFQDLQLLDCSLCACAAAAGSCTATGAFYSTPDCTGQVGEAFSATSSMCAEPYAFTDPGTLYAMATVTSAQDGACAPSEANTALSVCQLEAGSVCAANGDACAPIQEGASCVLIDGTACPAGYPSSRPVHLPPDTCGCSCTKQEVCPSEIRAYPGPNCLFMATVVALNGCTSTNLEYATSVRAPASMVTCTAASVPPSSPRTLCCAM